MGTITDKLNKLAETKSAIKTAIVNKGITVTDTDTFASYADKISSITSGGGGGYEFDFTVLGYNEKECKDANDIANAVINLGDYTQSQITEAIAYGKELYDSNKSITDKNVDKNKLLFYPKLKLPYTYQYSKILYIPNVEYKASGSLSAHAYTNYFLYKVGNINAKFTSSYYSQGFFTDCVSLREVGDINITGRVIDYSAFFENCYVLRKIGNINTTGSTSFYSMFQNCHFLTAIPQLDTSSGTNFGYMVENCESLTSISQLNTSNGTNFTAMFEGCESLPTIPQLDTSKGTNFSSIFWGCSKLKRVEGISFKSVNSTINRTYLSGYSAMTQLRYMLIKDIGTCTGMTKVDFSQFYVWGINDETNTDARQSLVDSLLTYSFDRATAGYSTCTITLSSETKKVLTSDEKAQITSKGYKIA